MNAFWRFDVLRDRNILSFCSLHIIISRVRILPYSLGIMCPIPDTWHNFSTVNITVEELCQHREKKKSCSWLLNNRASDCWRIMPVTVEESSQPQFNNCAKDYWTILPLTVEESCQPLLNNCSSDCQTIVPATVEQFCQGLLNIRASCYWRIMSVTVEELC